MIFTLTNNTYAIPTDNLELETLYERANQISSNPISYIPVGSNPTAIGVNPQTNKIYVANSGDGTVSVIDGRNLTKIKDIEIIDVYNNTSVRDKELTIEFSSIGVNQINNTIYVANKYNNTVSVIDGSNLTKIKDIEIIDVYNNTSVRDKELTIEFSSIGVNQINNTIYVANSGDSTGICD